MGQIIGRGGEAGLGKAQAQARTLYGWAVQPITERQGGKRFGATGGHEEREPVCDLNRAFAFFTFAASKISDMKRTWLMACLH